ncbi:hypothetical protein C7B65_24880 [Phormidesmis priestleyi ULC007]|uniref:CopG family transcriptional regulator n=1 Tax=Phormidesmis priestleyi ULC007 TaxID=1920490 RepID=A0A2T1D3X5_9CYAN|nr:hypothetical protein [Phormidesmis priestleyi]MCY7272196.1 hypothetical protein [Phormidesmis sp. CAN_BIN44]PSB15225.1 hypothetical protein C7B65_24880 [Phormidesmis priestleyi ULC007]
MQTSNVRSELRVQIPEKIRQALEAYASENQFPMDLVIEMALAQFLDVDAVTFDDCNPVMSPGQLREEIEVLRYQLDKQ